MHSTSRALAFAARWFDEATVQRVFEPLIADWQREWRDASGARRWSASIRGLAAFICAVLVSSPRVLRQPAPLTVTNRVAVRITRFTAITTILLTGPWWNEYGSLGFTLLLIVPSVLALTFPFAMIGAVDAVRCDHALPPHVERATIAKLAMASLVFMVILGGFVIPATNQAFRSASYLQSLRAQGPEHAARAARLEALSYAPPRGLRERNTYELLTDHGFTDGTRYLRETVNMELHNRASLAVLPVMLMWLRWRLLDLPRRRWSPLPPTVIAVAAYVGYMLLRQSGPIVEGGLGLSRGAGAWSPLVVLSVMMWLDSWRRARKSVCA